MGAIPIGAFGYIYIREYIKKYEILLNQNL